MDPAGRERLYHLLQTAAHRLKIRADRDSQKAGGVTAAQAAVMLVIARERGIHISTTRQDQSGMFEGYIKVTVVTEARERSVAGTVFSDGKPRFIQIKGITVDAEIGANMVYTTNEDVPGIIGALGQTMGENGVNIANFTLGRSQRGGEAIAMPLGSLSGVGPDDEVTATGGPFTVRASRALLGRVVDGLGRPLDGGPDPASLPGAAAWKRDWYQMFHSSKEMSIRLRDLSLAPTWSAVATTERMK